MLSFKLINKKRVCVEAEILLIIVIIACIISAEFCVWSCAIFSTVSGWFSVSECACFMHEGFLICLYGSEFVGVRKIVSKRMHTQSLTPFPQIQS